MISIKMSGEYEFTPEMERILKTLERVTSNHRCDDEIMSKLQEMMVDFDYFVFNKFLKK